MFAIEHSGQGKGEQGFEREHQRGGKAAGALQAPCEQHRREHCAERCHHRKARKLPGAKGRFVVLALEKERCGSGGACVKQAGGAPCADACAEFLDERCGRAEQRCRAEGKQGA